MKVDEALGGLVAVIVAIAAILAAIKYAFSFLVYIFGHPIFFFIGAISIGAIASVIHAEKKRGWSMPSTVSSVSFGNFETSLRNLALASTIALVALLLTYRMIAL